METEEEDVETEEREKGRCGQNGNRCSTNMQLFLRRFLRLVFTILVLTFAAAFVGVITNHDFIPFFTEHARELSKHRTREERVEFHWVRNIERFPHKNVRLPKDLKPLTYQLDLRVNLTTQRFRGKVRIETLCENSTRYYIFHSGDLDITNVLVSKAQGNGDEEERMVVQRILAYKKYQLLCIELMEPLLKGDIYYATLEFKSKISHRLEGFYRSTYTSNTGEERSLAMTHFEPAHARKAFPCFDEPSFKASFSISIIHDPQYYALSNMPVARSVTREDGLVEEHFAPSVNMSSYLVAFAVLDFKYQEMKTASGVQVRVHAPPDDFNRLDLALKTGVQVLSYYEKLFGEPFPLPKLDLLAVPDFLIGAMEEWGLVMFRRAYLIYDEQFCTTAAKLKNIQVIAHELAHQWFGNLVTLNWWNDVWLNEGFAILVQDDFGSNHVIKGWDMRELVVSGSWQSALQADSLWNSHPISVPVHSPEEIDDIFDSISYLKGGMTLRMLMNFLGEENFMNGVKCYIQKYKYGNADAEELWRAIGQANGGVDVVKMMRVWTNQNGFPIIDIRKYEKLFYVQQEEALQLLNNNDNNTEYSTKREKWFVPLSYYSQSKRQPKLLMVPPINNSYPLTDVPASDWIKANVDASGFFIVNYDADNWRKLAIQLARDHQVFSPSDRASLIHDVFTLTCAGLLDPILALNLSRYLVREKHQVPWAVMRKVSKCMLGVLEKQEKRLYKKFLWSLQEHLIKLLGIEDTGTDKERFFRYDVLSEAMRSGQRKDIKSKFTGLFNELKKTPLGSAPHLGPNFRSLAFTFGANKSNEEDWDFLWSVYRKSPFDSDRKLLMYILASFNTDNIRNRSLNYSLDETKVRPQDTLYWIEAIDKGHGKSDARWEFITKNWKSLTRQYGGSYKLGNMIKAVTGSFHTEYQLKEVIDFFNSLGSGEIAKRAQSQTIEKIQRRIAGRPPQLKTNTDRIGAWLKEYMKPV